MNSRRSIVDTVIAYWRDHNVPYLPGVSDGELLAFERRHAVTFQNDARCFFEATNGTRVPNYSGCDHNVYEFWTLADIVPDSEHGWIMNFADYMMNSWWYGIDFAGAGGLGKGAVYLLGASGGKPLIVAGTFTEFLELYVIDSERLYANGALAYHTSLTVRE
jgi:hypothetical protein